MMSTSIPEHCVWRPRACTQVLGVMGPAYRNQTHSTHRLGPRSIPQSAPVPGSFHSQPLFPVLSTVSPWFPVLSTVSPWFPVLSTVSVRCANCLSAVSDWLLVPLVEPITGAHARIEVVGVATGGSATVLVSTDTGARARTNAATCAWKPAVHIACLWGRLSVAFGSSDFSMAGVSPIVELRRKSRAQARTRTEM